MDEFKECFQRFRGKNIHRRFTDIHNIHCEFYKSYTCSQFYRITIIINNENRKTIYFDSVTICKE